MTACRINDDEIDALSRSDNSSHISPMAKLVYLLAIRPYMDFATGMVGSRRMVTYQSIRECIEYFPPQGSKRKEIRHSKDLIHSLLEELERFGLIEWIKTPGRGLIFRCILADRDISSENMRAPREHPESAQKRAPREHPEKIISDIDLSTCSPPYESTIETEAKIEKRAPPPVSGIRTLTQEHRTVKEHKGLTHMSLDPENAVVLLPVNGDPVVQVFRHWQSAMGKLDYRLDEVRRKAIADRLNDGYTPEQLMRAVTGCAQSEWHMGKNEKGRAYNDISLICRDAVHVDQFLEISRGKQKSAGKWDEFLDQETTIVGEVVYGKQSKCC